MVTNCDNAWKKCAAPYVLAPSSLSHTRYGKSLSDYIILKLQAENAKKGKSVRKRKGDLLSKLLNYRQYYDRNDNN